MPKNLIFGATTLVFLVLMLLSYDSGRTSDVFFAGFLVMLAFSIAETTEKKSCLILESVVFEPAA